MRIVVVLPLCTATVICLDKVNVGYALAVFLALLMWKKLVLKYLCKNIDTRVFLLQKSNNFNSIEIRFKFDLARR